MTTFSLTPALSMAPRGGNPSRGPGQGAQAVGMGKTWCEQSAAARAVFDEADTGLGDQLGGSLSSLCFDGPADRLNRTDVSQPAIYACGVACWAGMREQAASAGDEFDVIAAAGLSLGEYTALHLAGVFDFATGLRLVADRGRLMQARDRSSSAATRPRATGRWPRPRGWGSGRRR